ncbi:hypothetical protein PybrP1_011249 [[Pythium] brassicae (nom. inval.)]|nr:hypothetical protein PybrP1_011249 [[Pythium] brassicae (nom. inval.)]
MSTDVNVKVAVRCRPMSSREAQAGARNVVEVLDGTTVIVHGGSADSESADAGRKQFTFDHAYGAESTQAQVYDDIARPTVGIVPLMNRDIFRRVDEAQRAHPALKFLVTVSFLEIYNEVIKDLLNPSDKLLKIREHPDMGIYVEQLAELIVKDAADVARLLEQGNKVRQVAATQMNERSSRSHSCFTLKISSKRSEEVAGGGKIIRELREEIERLRQLVTRPSSASTAPVADGERLGTPLSARGPTSEVTTQMEEMIANLERAKQQSWDEKQRLTELYEQERLNSLASEKKILGFMQTVKQEKMDIVKRVKALQQRKLRLAKDLRQRKQSYAAHKSRLQADVEAFQSSHTAAASALSAPATATEKQRLLDGIEACKALVIADRDEMGRLKDALQLCDDKLVEEEAEIAAKSALLEEDDDLRRAIQDDEREKMRLERAQYLQAALEDERRQFQREAEQDTQKLHLALGATLDKEKKLLEEVERQRAKAVAFQQQLHDAHVEHAEWRRAAAAKLSHLVAALRQDFEAELHGMETKYAYVVGLLRGARDDIVALGERNEELERRLQNVVASWEETW